MNNIILNSSQKKVTSLQGRNDRGNLLKFGRLLHAVRNDGSQECFFGARYRKFI